MTRDEARRALSDARPVLLGVAGRIIRGGGVAADDAVQDAYLKALRAVESGDFPREPGHLMAWFTKVVHGAVYDSLRREGRRKDRLAGGAESEAVDRRAGPLDQLIERENVASTDKAVANLPRAIGELPDGERAAVELRFRGMTNRQIALELGVPQGSISALMRSAYQMLRVGLGRADRR
jgi:RNA polymerase sigma factor (sigma-70 family)